MKKKYLSSARGSSRASKRIFKVNPTLPPVRTEPEQTIINIYSYNENVLNVKQTNNVADLALCNEENMKYWIDVCGIRKDDIEEIGRIFNVHLLITEDILSMGQRPKLDDSEDFIYTLMYMMYTAEDTGLIENEQISILLGRDFVISFREGYSKKLFNRVKARMEISESRIRTFSSDYLFYALIDVIVDNYFIILENLGETIEFIEEEIIRNATNRTLTSITVTRKEMVLIKRNIVPVREVINNILRNESKLLEDRTEKYFKDIYDHIVQASELSENYREIVINLHDLYLSELNLKMNEVMKVMAIVTCLLAPATVIGGIFGMNFSRIPWLASAWGFYIAVAIMLLIPIGMMYLFKRRGWF